jgi:two-component sensor histidine kinase
MAIDAPKTGFGLTVVQLMTQQLRGRLDTAPSQPGLRLSVSVPMDTQTSAA